MKTILILLTLTLSAFSQERPKPNWLDKETIWTDSGKIYIKIHTTNKDLDWGMTTTFARFREELVSHYCQSEDRCIYFNLTTESYWEAFQEDESLTYDIYRLYSIQDVYPH